MGFFPGAAKIWAKGTSKPAFFFTDSFFSKTFYDESFGHSWKWNLIQEANASDEPAEAQIQIVQRPDCINTLKSLRFVKHIDYKINHGQIMIYLSPNLFKVFKLVMFTS